MVYEKDDWCTPVKYIEMAREVMGDIDLDPASNDFAQERIKAKQYYTKETNGLDKPWNGRVWLNPPYSRIITKFVNKLIWEYGINNCKQAIMLVNSKTDTRWFQRLLNMGGFLCFVNGRISFEHPEREAEAPRHPNAFFYFGTDYAKFLNTFRNIGVIVKATV